MATEVVGTTPNKRSASTKRPALGLKRHFTKKAIFFGVPPPAAMV